MEIISYEFFGFVVLCLAIFFLLPYKLQNIFLLAASYYFYATFTWKYAAVLAVITLFNFWYAHRLRPTEQRRAWPLWPAIILNLLTFSVFLFHDFFGEQLSNAYQLLGTEGITVRLLLPIGFSYYLLECISYLIDIKRKQMKPIDNLVNFALYLAYFPKLVSGPIERARNFLPQLTEPRIVDNRMARRSMMLIFVGISRTAIFADMLLIIIPFDLFSDPLSHGNLELVMWLFAYALVLYNQFAGYTNIVRGVSGLFGIELSANFAQPFFSQNFSDFWTRWHISLSQWLRDYIFLPISRYFLRRNPSRRNLATIFIPPMATMLVSGLWHGARPNLMLWGALMGGYMIAEQLLTLFRKVDPSKKRSGWQKMLSFGIIVGLGLIAAIPFKLDILGSKIYLYGIIKAENWFIPSLWPLLFFAGILLFDYAQYRSNDEFVFLKASRWTKAVMMGSVIIVMVIIDNLQAAFLPFTYP